MSETARTARAGAGRSHASRLPATAKRRPSGFTVVELMLVVAIIAVVAAIALPSFQGYMDRAKVAQATSDIRSIDVAVAQYDSDNRTSSDDLADLGKGSLHRPLGKFLRVPQSRDVKGKGKHVKTMRWCRSTRLRLLQQGQRRAERLAADCAALPRRYRPRRNGGVRRAGFRLLSLRRR